jgi:ATP-binding cassette subfamily A (ABC1) protein 3
MALVPVAMAALVVLSLNPSEGTDQNRPARAITLSAYSDPVTFLASDNSSTANSLAKEYQASLGGDGSVQTSMDAVEDILDLASAADGIARYTQKFIIGASFSESPSLKIVFGNRSFSVPGFKNVQLTALYNSVPLHARPLAQLHTSNALLGLLEGNRSIRHTIISVTNHPLPQSKSSQFERVASDGVDRLTYAFGISLPLGLAILISSFLIFPLAERATSAKQVQLMTGLHPATFWAASLLWDLLLFLLPGLLLLATLLLLDTSDTFLTHGAWAAMLLIILLLGLSGTPFAYVFSFLADNAASGFALLVIVNIMAGCIAPTAVFMLRNYGSQGDSATLVEISDIVR